MFDFGTLLGGGVAATRMIAAKHRCASAPAATADDSTVLLNCEYTALDAPGIDSHDLEDAATCLCADQLRIVINALDPVKSATFASRWDAVC